LSISIDGVPYLGFKVGVGWLDGWLTGWLDGWLTGSLDG